MRKVVILALALVCAPEGVGGQALHPDSLFPRLIGQWVLRGTIARQETVHDVIFEWLLGRDPQSGAYACLWMDNTAAAAFPPEGTGRGSVAGDSIPFLFHHTATTSFHTTFVYDRANDSWQWQMDNDSSGVRRPFARVTLTRSP